MLQCSERLQLSLQLAVMLCKGGMPERDTQAAGQQQQ